MATQSPKEDAITTTAPVESEETDVDSAMPESTKLQPAVQSVASQPAASSPKHEPKLGRHGVRRFFHKFQPASQLPLSWLLAWSSCACFILTVYYAFGTTFLVPTPMITTSPGNTVRVIRILSAVTQMLMAGLVAGCFERLKWMLVASKKGSPILDFLSLSEGTGPLGMLVVALARVKNIKSSRGWTLLRAFGLLIVPALGVLILSDVDVSQIYISNDGFPVAAGIGEFNASFADNSETRLASGILFASDFGSFLTNSKLSYPTSPVSSSQTSCTNGGGAISGDCVLSYYVPGGIGLISPWPTLNYSLPNSPLYTVRQISGYHFDFSALDDSANFNGASDCTIYGGDLDAVMFCFSASDTLTLNIKWINCPIDISSNAMCIKDASWQASTAWTASLQAYRRTATVHYYRSNITIAAVTNLDPPRPVNLSPSDLFRAYNATFQPAGSLAEFTAGRQFITYLNSFLSFALVSNATQNSAADQLRNLAVLPLYYFQPTYLNPALNPSPNAPAPNLPKELYTTAAFSYSEYRLVVSRATLIAYTVIGSVLLLACLVVLVLGSLQVVAGRIADCGPFQALDLVVGCTDGNSVDELPARLRELRGTKGTNLLQKLKGIRVYLPERKNSVSSVKA